MADGFITVFNLEQHRAKVISISWSVNFPYYIFIPSNVGISSLVSEFTKTVVIYLIYLFSDFFSSLFPLMFTESDRI